MIYVLDLDGTLIDSSERHWRLMREILSEVVPQTVSESAPETASESVSGKRFDPAEFMRYKADGYNGSRYLTDCLELTEDAADQIMTLWQRQIEGKQWLALDVLYPDTLAFLERLKQKHMKIYYLTARGNQEGLLQELDRLKITDYAVEIRVVSPADAREEKKRVVETILAEAGEDAGSVRIVGDTENEYHLAEELSLPCYLLNRGFRSEKYWEDRGVKSVASLCEIE